MTQGLFISVEGIDGAGKSTHVSFIGEYLESTGKTVIITREPGGTELGESLRNLLLNSDNMHRNTELLLMFAARQELITKVLLPNLQQGVCVISDRFVDASFAYQGAGRALGADKVRQLMNCLEPVVVPNLTLLFDAPLAVALARMNKNKDRIEREGEGFFARVQNAYLDIATAQPERVKVIKTNQSCTATRAEIIQHLDYLLDMQK